MHPQPGRVSLQCFTASDALTFTSLQIWASSTSALFHHWAISKIHLWVSCAFLNAPVKVFTYGKDLPHHDSGCWHAGNHTVFSVF